MKQKVRFYMFILLFVALAGIILTEKKVEARTYKGTYYMEIPDNTIKISAKKLHIKGMIWKGSIYGSNYREYRVNKKFKLAKKVKYYYEDVGDVRCSKKKFKKELKRQSYFKFVIKNNKVTKMYVFESEPG